jgi:hypothetical protein
LGNIPVVVVNSAASAKVLFGQHAQALSSRPEFYTFHRVRSYNSIVQFRLTKNSRFYRTRQEQPSGHHHTATR